MDIKLLRTFLPSIDFKVSRQFYIDLGFIIRWESDDLIEFGTKEHSFFLQKYYQKDWAENLMMQMFVSNLDSLYEVAEPLIKKYENTKIKPIFSADYGRTFHVIGPAGELWHMTEVSKEIDDHHELICNE